MISSMHEIYGAERAGHILEFVPSFDNTLLPFQVFMIYILIQWWVRYDSDGTGYIAQRINTAKTPEDARSGTLLFSIGFVALRTWPWILVALVSLVLFPIDNPGVNYPEYGALIEGDREMAYPLLMKILLPAGLLGLAFTSLMAAFMSTVDTHLNWGASYLVNDIYLRFSKKEKDEKSLIRFSRLMVFLILVIAILVSSQMESIENAWKFFITAASGLGVAHLIRWFWWRANAFTEIAAMAAALVATIFVTYIKPDDAGADFETYALLGVTAFNIVSCVVWTLITPAVSSQQLQKFIDRTNPIGLWQGKEGKKDGDSFSNSLMQWVMGLTISYGSLFAIGYVLLHQYWSALISVVLVILAILWLNNNSKKLAKLKQLA